jgi:hypothetical protein
MVTVTKQPENGNGFPTDLRAAATLYLERFGVLSIPLYPKSKKPIGEHWQEQRPGLDDLAELFPQGQARNLGSLLGEPSKNLLDVDLDCPEAIRAAPNLLPCTGWRFGRRSAPISHWVFRTERSLRIEQFYDVDSSKLLELRGTGHQTVFPPSLHADTGEEIAWETFTEPAQLLLDDLQRSVRCLAAAVLLARHWPRKGSRDKAAMALTGALVRAGWDEETVSHFVETVAVAAGDEEARVRAGKAVPTSRKQAKGEETTGWPTLIDLLGDSGEDVVERVQEWLDLAETVPTELPLPAESPWPSPLPTEAYHGIVGEIVQTIDPHSEADPAALLFQVLVGVGNIVGREEHFQVEADRHHANEFLVLVGRTSKARKGSSWGHVRYLLSQVEEHWVTERVQSGLSSGEGLIWAVRDPITSREKTKEGKEIRYVEVEKDPGIEDKRLLVYEPEFANVLKQVERQGNTLSVILRQAWDGGECLRTMTKNSPARSTGAFISMIGHITTAELRRLLSATETANGFGNRILWVGAERSKLLPEGGNLDRQQLDALAIRVIEQLAKARGRGRIYRDDECRALWAEVYGDLSEGRPGMAGALMARAEAHVTRLSMTYAILDGAEVISVVHLMAALSLWQYVEQTILHVFGDSLGDPVADDLLHLLRASPGGLTRTDISTFLGRNQSAERIGRALGLLFQQKLARHETVKPRGRGRPEERWYTVTPKKGT